MAPGSYLIVDGNLKSGSGSALARLTTVEGNLILENGQVTAVTPANGTLNIAKPGILTLSQNTASPTTISITGNLSNAGQLNTGGSGGHNVVNVSGALINTGLVSLYGSSDLANASTLTNNGEISLGTGSRLNLTNQPGGITDIPANTGFALGGSFTAGSASALATLSNIEGGLTFENGQANVVTPKSGTLAISSTGNPSLSQLLAYTTLTVNGNVNNAGVYTMGTPKDSDMVNITGKLTNSGTFSVGSLDWANIGTLNNSGTMTISGGNPLTSSRHDDSRFID